MTKGDAIASTADEEVALLVDDLNQSAGDIGATETAADVHLRRALYVARDGVKVASRQGQFVVQDGEVEVLAAPISLVSQLVLIGAVGLSAGARSTAFYESIPVTFLSRRGRWLGRFDNGSGHEAVIRRAQYRMSGVEAESIELARQFVLGKVANQRALLLRYGRREAMPGVIGVAESLRQTHRDARRATTLNSLRGFEGIAARNYFDGLRLLVPDEFSFDGRNRRPPKDPVNSCLSFGYSVLVGEATSALAVVGLDPVAGFLHEDHERRPSLALDLIEEFRPLIVDTVVLELVRRGVLSNDDFRSEDSGGVFLNTAGRKKFLEGVEERLLTQFSHVPSGKRVSYRRSIVLQAQQIRKVISGDSDEYVPVSWR